MKTIIAQNPQYEISVVIPKNRAYLKIIGFWRNPEQVSSYLDDWEKAIAILRPGFTLLADVREMKIHPGTVRDLHEEAQRLVIKAGLKKTAEILPHDVAIVQLNALANKTKMPRRSFNNEIEAEEWLEMVES